MEFVMSSDKEKKSKLGLILTGSLKIFLPFSAMSKTLKYAKREYEISKENIKYIRSLKNSALEQLKNSKDKREQANTSFNKAITQRSKDALSIEELLNLFKKRKQITIAFGLMFLLFSSYTLIAGIINLSNKTIVLSALSILCSQPLFFISALGSELRIWQLSTKRLSKEEQGGLNDFQRENRKWWFNVINPYFNPKNYSEQVRK